MLGAGAAQLGLLEAARARGLFVIAVDRDPGAPGFAYADRRAIVPVDDEPALERLAEAERIDAVIAPGADQPVGAAARIAARLSLPHPLSPETAVLSTSKLRQRERLAEAGVPQTRWRVVSTPDEVVGVPCIVRPPDRQGRRARAVVRSSRELRTAVKAALHGSRTGLCLVEELAESPVVSVSAFSRDGVFHPLIVTDRAPLVDVWESEHARPANALARQAAVALGIRNGPTVTRISMDQDGPKVLELSARLGGGHDADLCHAAVGVDLDGLALSAALGEPVSDRRLRGRRRVGGACLRFLPAEGEPDGLEQAAAIRGVRWVRSYRGSDRAGALLATGATREQALARATLAAECIRFRAADAQVV